MRGNFNFLPFVAVSFNTALVTLFQWYGKAQALRAAIIMSWSLAQMHQLHCCRLTIPKLPCNFDCGSCETDKADTRSANIGRHSVSCRVPIFKILPTDRPINLGNRCTRRLTVKSPGATDDFRRRSSHRHGGSAAYTVHALSIALAGTLCISFLNEARGDGGRCFADAFRSVL